MSNFSKIREVLFALFVALAIVPSLLLLIEFWRVNSRTDAQLSASFVGAAQEDIFGFGFWPLWLGLAVVESAFLCAAWLLVSRSSFRRVVIAALATFLTMSAFGYVAFVREFALWSGYVSLTGAG